MKNILFAIPITLTSILYGCEKTVPPEETPIKLYITSPQNNKMYNKKVLPIQWHYEGNIKYAWICVNGGEKFPISDNDGSLNWGFTDGINKVVLGVEDNTYVKKDSVSFCAGKFIK